MSRIAMRRATLADAGELARHVADGLEDYRSFAPPGWSPPAAADEAEHLRERLRDDAVVCLVAEEDGRIVGQVTILPASRAARPVAEPALAHLANLFVDRARWGTGLATRLHDAALAAARERGFEEVRLFAAEGQARARGFYEREGWSPAGEPFHDPVPGLVLLEYRRPLTIA